MPTKEQQQKWRERKKSGEIKPCQGCGGRNNNKQAEAFNLCQRCWFKTVEGKAYNQEKVARGKDKFDKVAEAKRIADWYRKELGFVNRAALAEAEKRGELEVIQYVGFAHFHHRRDKQTTIYEIAVSLLSRGLGWGRLLFYRVLCSSIERGCDRIVAKCPVDLPSNEFYAGLGFKLVETEPGKKRQLNRWQYDIKLPLLFYCADGGKSRYSSIASECGWRLGVNSSATHVGTHCEMIDNEWEDYNHQRHLEQIKHHKPLIATVKDVENSKELPKVLKQAREVAAYCGKVIIVPKAKTWLPEYYWLGYSIPTSHGGTDIEPEWFGDRFVHLLGGSPTEQAKKSQQMRVVSLDGNYAMKLAKNGVAVWQGEEARKVGGCYDAFRLSVSRQRDCWHTSIDELPLFQLLNQTATN